MRAGYDRFTKGPEKRPPASLMCRERASVQRAKAQIMPIVKSRAEIRMQIKKKLLSQSKLLPK